MAILRLIMQRSQMCLTSYISALKKIIFQGPVSVTLGDDHFIILPILRDYDKKYERLIVIQFDAYSDLWANDDIGRIDHGTLMYKAVELGLVDVKRFVQIRISTDCNGYLGIPCIDACAVHEKYNDYVIEKVKQIVGNVPTYLSFDIVALDPAFAPGMGTPVWGGLAR